jgi:hypothetical protein
MAVYLSTQGRHVWVGHKEVARGDIFGPWKRFTYYCNGVKQYIYCRTQKVFLILFAHWCSWAKGNYNYTLNDVDGVDISTEDIIMDNPDSKPFRVKSWVFTQHGEYIQ